MRRFVPLLVMCAVVAGAFAAQAAEFRFPKTGKHAFQISLLEGWRARTDGSGGMLLVPPGAQHAMVYLAITVDEKMRGQPERAIAAAAAKVAGIELTDKQDPARISDAKGASVIRGTAFYGTLHAKRGLTRRAKIVVFKLAPSIWAQVWTLIQPGINSVETEELDQTLNGISLMSEK